MAEAVLLVSTLFYLMWMEISAHVCSAHCYAIAPWLTKYFPFSTQSAPAAEKRKVLYYLVCSRWYELTATTASGEEEQILNRSNKAALTEAAEEMTSVTLGLTSLKTLFLQTDAN